MTPILIPDSIVVASFAVLCIVLACYAEERRKKQRRREERLRLVREWEEKYGKPYRNSPRSAA
jgi:hypothetical protein